MTHQNYVSALTVTQSSGHNIMVKLLQCKFLTNSAVILKMKMGTIYTLVP